MAIRRMIGKTVTQTQKFLRLPLEAQALYFHLIQNADDDGVVEAFPVLRMIGASEDSLGLLVVKRLIKPLNDEMVYFVIDFFEQNNIQPHHYKASIYQSLLGDEEKAQNKRIKKTKKKVEGYQDDNKMLTFCDPSIGKDSIVKDKLGKNSIGQENINNATADFSEIYSYYQQEIGVLSPNQAEQLADYLKLDNFEPELLKRAIDKASSNAKRSFGYVNSILRNWRQNGITTLVQAEEEDRKFHESKQQPAKSDIESTIPDLPF